MELYHIRLITCLVSAIIILLQIPTVGSLCTNGYYEKNPGNGCITCESNSYCYKGVKRPCPPNSTSATAASSISECFCLSDMECIPYRSTHFKMTLDQFEGSKKGIGKYLAAAVGIDEEAIVFEIDDTTDRNTPINIQAFIPISDNLEAYR